MNRFNPLLAADFYKVGHVFQYTEGTTLVYSNFTPRKSRLNGVDKVAFFGLQYFIKDFLIDWFDKEFFAKDYEDVLAEYGQVVIPSIGPLRSYAHIEQLHGLGYLPLAIKALPEGTRVRMGIPCMTIMNTHPDFFWLPNFIETILSCYIWQACTSATIAYQYRAIFDYWANLTSDAVGFVDFQGHDFSMRGMSSLESACISSAGHLLSFSGTDTIPGILFAKKYYAAEGAVGYSVPATEHSVMCAGSQDGEIQTFNRLITETYPSGIVSIVSDTWDLWKVLTEYLPALKDTILARDGKVVIRPDSGDPVLILCGNPNGKTEVEQKGVIQLLWDVFGGTVNSKGYKEIDPHVGAIYGDSITLERANSICKLLEEHGFASTNWVAGIGSFTYQFNTRDTFGFAMKATYIEHNGVGESIFKDPVTDDGTKKSARGLLRLDCDADGEIILLQDCTWEQEGGGLLSLVFQDGEICNEQSFDQIKEVLYASK